MNTRTPGALVASPAEQGTHEPICCPVVSGKQIARIDVARRLLYLWCKACKGWHEYDLKALEEQHASAKAFIA